MAEAALAKKLNQIVEEYEKGWQQRVKDFEKRVERLEQENEKLREELSEHRSRFGEITDEILRKRLTRLGSSPLDTVIREAGVVLEHRLRMVSDADTSVYGVRLVDAVLSPETGMLIFSPHKGEQEGVRLLYRGAMQFIRNPPMHKLIEYPHNTAQLLVRLIDALLQLLSEGELRQRDAVSIEAIQLMLTRRRIPNGQLALYKALHNAGEEGLLMPELATKIKRTRDQVAGVLGALGLRINNSEGLEGKGGIQVVFDISEKEGEWHYRMRPILREALRKEKIV